MSVDFELATTIDSHGETVLGVDAYTNEASIDITDQLGRGTGATFTGDQMRQLRRFLEYCYPASEDGEHDPDPWEKSSSPHQHGAQSHQ